MEHPIKKITCYDMAGKPYETTTDQLFFRPSAYGVVVQDGNILLSKQYDGFDFPGGGANVGETMEEALVREYKEETGFDVRVHELLYYQDTFYHSISYNAYYQGLMFYFRCEIVGGEASIAGAMEDELAYMGLPEWIPLHEVREHHIYTTADVEKILSRI